MVTCVYELMLGILVVSFRSILGSVAVYLGAMTVVGESRLAEHVDVSMMFRL